MAMDVEVRAYRYNSVAAGVTAQALVGDATAPSSTVRGTGQGAVGDLLERVIIVPGATNAGTVTLVDGSTSMNILVSGTLADLSPLTVELHARSQNGPWKITTGSSVTCICVGHFT